MFIIKSSVIGMLPFIIFFVGYWVVPVKDNHWIREYEKKCELLEATPSPKIIFVSGSNLAFGLESKRIKESLNINVVNYALAIHLGLKYMIDDVSTYIKKGDIVVFAPEWQHFYSYMYGFDAYPSMVMKLCNWNKFFLLNRYQLKELIIGIPDYLKQNLLPQKVTKHTTLNTSYNEFGDQYTHWYLDTIYKSHPQPITKKFDKNFGKYFIDRLNELQSKCTVIMIPPACCCVAMKKWNKQVKEVEEFLKNNGHPFIIDPDSCSFAEEYIYDNDYHLNKKGVDIRTSSVIDALKDYIIN